MSERRRVSGWFVLSIVFLVAVFGLFFTFTERKSWPEQHTELAPADMKLAPVASTLWCEAVALRSKLPFVAYQVSEEPKINPKLLERQKLSLNRKLSSRSNRSYFKLKYYLLKSSVMQIYVCASAPGARLLVFQGEKDVLSYLNHVLHSRSTKKDSDSSDSESNDDSPEKESDKLDCDFSKASHSYTDWNTVKCRSLVSNTEVVDDEGENVEYGCEGLPALHPVLVNITATDFYVVAVVSTDYRITNNIGLRVLLDRARYTFHKSGLAFDMCSLSTDCTIGLTFASQDRVLLQVPEEGSSGRESTSVIRSQCKPRLAVFAVLSVFFPLIIFIAVAFVVRADRERIMQHINRGNRTAHTSSTHGFVVAPLLDDGLARSASVEGQEELPPSYNSLFDAPPPYACIKKEEDDK